MNKIIEGLSLAAVAATITASFYLYRFYQFIGINIFNYLDVSEILISQFQLLLVFSYAIILSFFYILAPIITAAHFFAPKEVEDETPDLEPKADAHRADIATEAAKKTTINWLYFPGITMTGAIAIVSLSWIVFLIFFFYSPIKSPLTGTFAMTGTLGISVAFFNKFASKSFFKLYRGKYFSNRPLVDEIEKVIKLLIITEGVVGMLAFTNLLAQYRMQGIMLESTQNNLSIELDNRTIKTNDTLIYVGRTRNFIILYYKNKESTQIIPSDKINSLILSPGSKSKIVPKSYLNTFFTDIISQDNLSDRVPTPPISVPPVSR